MLACAATALLPMAAMVAAPSADTVCRMGGAPWVPQGKSPLHGLQTITQLSATHFNMSFHIRHGPTGGVGEVLPDNKVSMEVMKGNQSLYSCHGVISAACNNITWGEQTGGPDPEKSTAGCFGLSWCRAWSPGCDSPEPPYGQGFAFLSSQGSNMVLQQAPAKSAVYGIVVGNPTAVKVTVHDEEKHESYEVDAEFNTTHQPFGPQFVGGEAGYATAGAYIGGPHTTWKAFLKPTAAGGNFTITAACTGCYEDRESPFSTVNVSNVTFGDVWHCSGQSNSQLDGHTTPCDLLHSVSFTQILLLLVLCYVLLTSAVLAANVVWLPVGNSFAHNETIANVSAGKYHNIRLMAGNSGNCPGQDGGTCPWMTASQATISPTKSGRGPAPVPPLFNFGAACWYFAAKLSDQLEAAGKLVPIGVTDTAIGGQRIEEYMVNDTTLTACADRTGATSPEWNGRLFGKQTLPFVDSTIKGWL
eukprot:SAG31_NODE_2475_length_5641_cov_2.038434_4_plen_473_part_00